MIKGFIAGAHDLLHPGHLATLEEAKSQCDYLIVALHSDPTIDRPDTKDKPMQTIYARFVQLKGCKFVDEIIPYDTEEDLLNMLQMVRPDIRFLGEDYRGKPFTGSQLPIKVIYTARQHNFSSSGLRKKLQNA